MTIILGVLALPCIYVIYALHKLGYYARIPLTFSKISLEQIPAKAAKRYGDREIFFSDTPCAWGIPQLSTMQTKPSSWSANALNLTAGFVGAVIQRTGPLNKGDRVAILKENHFDIQLLMMSAVRAGGVACPINADFVSDKLHPYLKNLGSKIFISDANTLHRLINEGAEFADVRHIILADCKLNHETQVIMQLEECAKAHISKLKSLVWIEDALQSVTTPISPTPRGKEEPIYLTHSSGTTGFPKSVILTNGGQSHAARGMVAYSVIAKNDKAYVAIPFNHQACMTTFNSALIAGVQTYWASKTKFDLEPRKVLEKLAKDKFAAFFSFPIAYVQMAGEDLDQYDLSSMKIWGCTADACHEVLQRKFSSTGSFFKNIGLPIQGSVFVDAQGSSEVGTPSVMRYITVLTRKFERRVGRWGSVPFGPRIKIVKSDGTIAKTGETGRLYVKGKTVTPGYWNNHAKTYAEFDQKWFFTGDVARKLNGGTIVQLDREVDVIHSREGEIYSLPIEEKIHKHNAVFDCCVYGARQPDGYQKPAVAVALRDGVNFSEQDLLVELNAILGTNEKLSSLKIIAYKDFPIGVTGKTLKRTFRDQTETGEVMEMNRPIFA